MANNDKNIIIIVENTYCANQIIIAAKGVRQTV